SNSRRLHGSTGSIIGVSSSRSATFLRQRRRSSTIAASSRPSRPDSNQRASGIPGAVQAVDFAGGGALRVAAARAAEHEAAAEGAGGEGRAGGADFDGGAGCGA